MKTFFNSASGLDARGVGPRIMLIIAPVLAAAVFFEIRPAPFTEIVPGKSIEAIVIAEMFWSKVL